jgi:uncharacterized LabA/DUF88 family protein
MPVRSEDTYLFVDREYLARIYNEAIRSLFACDGELDFQKIKQEARAKRAFIYDCLDDVRRAGESEPDCNARVTAQEVAFGEIRKLSGFHVRLGSLRGAPKKLRQKEVDVTLAVDMMTHGFDGNMEKAVLIAGDLDFRPIVEALVRRGVFVEVWYEKTSVAHELWWAADLGRELKLTSLYWWSTDSFKSKYPEPVAVSQTGPPAGAIKRTGTVEGHTALLIEKDFRHSLYIADYRGRSLTISHHDPAVIERYMQILYAPVQWA